MARILVVDDEPQVRGLIRRVLEHEGHTVELAQDGDLAVKAYRSNPADLVILDIYMPEKEGLETILELRDEYPEIRIVAMSGGGGAFGYDPLETAEHFGVERTITKPFDAGALLAAVNEVLIAR